MEVHPDQDIWAVRDRLPVERSWDYVHDGRTDRVRVALGAYWPETHVRIRPHESDIEIRGTFSRTGRLYEIEFTALTDAAEITTAELRWSGAIRVLREWEAVGREIASQVLAGKTPEEAVFDARTPTEALRILSQAARPRRVSQRRGQAHEQLLRDIADDYRALIAIGDPKPRVTLASKYGYSVANIGGLLVQARQPRNGRPPLLGPARPGKAGEDTPDTSAFPEEPDVDGQRPIALAIIVSACRVLVAERTDNVPPWTFPGGEVEPGDPASETVERETKEETSANVKAVRIIGRRDHPVTGRHMIYVEAALQPGPEADVGDPAELADVKWVGLAEVLELMPTLYEPVREYLARELAENPR